MINFILLSICSAGFAMLLQHCYDEGQVLNSYFYQIAKLPNWLFKPLGGCLPCQSFWIAVAVYCQTYGLPGSLQELAYLAMFTGANYLTIYIFALKNV